MIGFYKIPKARMPEDPVDGNIYFDVITQGLTFDIGEGRYRVNQAADWDETNEDSPAFIANRPNFGTASGKNIAESIGQSSDLPTAKQVYDALRERDSQIATLRNNFGTPLVANGIADMVDTTHPYVYAGSETGMVAGHWYYFDGEDWQDGGVYNAATYTTDKTLLLPDQPADAKTVGDALNQLEYAVLEHDSRFSFAIDENGHLIETVERFANDDITFSLSGGRMMVTYG